MELVLTFAKTNYSIQGEQLLLDAGIPVKVMPLPSSIKAGCGLCLRIQPERWEEVRGILEGHHVPVEGVFERIEN